MNRNAKGAPLGAPSLFDHSAELRAIQTGRPVSQERLLLAGHRDDPAPGPLFAADPGGRDPAPPADPPAPVPPILAAEADRRERYDAARERFAAAAACAAAGDYDDLPPPVPWPSPCFFARCPNDADVRCCGCRHAFCLPCGGRYERPCPLCKAAAGWSTEDGFEAWEDCAAAVAFFGDSINLLPPVGKAARPRLL